MKNQKVNTFVTIIKTFTMLTSFRRFPVFIKLAIFPSFMYLHFFSKRFIHSFIQSVFFNWSRPKALKICTKKLKFELKLHISSMTHFCFFWSEFCQNFLGRTSEKGHPQHYYDGTWQDSPLIASNLSIFRSFTNLLTYLLLLQVILPGRTLH